MVASGTNARLAYIAEATNGTTPASPAFKVLRCISRVINLKKDTLESEEVSQGRQRADVRHGFNRIEGEFGVELACDAYNDWLLASAGVSAPWQTINTATGNVNVTANNQITRTSGDWIDEKYRPGDWIVTAGFPNGANNFPIANPLRIVAVTGTVLTVNVTSLVNESGGGGASVAYVGRKVTVGAAGQALLSSSVEREITDLDGAGLNLYQIFRGVCVNRLTVSADPGSLAKATFGVLGMTADIDQSATLDADATYTAAFTASPLAGIDANVNDGTFNNIPALKFDFTLDNQRTTAALLGARTTPGLFEGVAKVTGSVSLTTTSTLRLGQYANETVLTQGWQLKLNELGTTNFLCFNFFRVKFTSHDMDPPQSGLVPQVLNWEALQQTFVGATTTFYETMSIQRTVDPLGN